MSKAETLQFQHKKAPFDVTSLLESVACTLAGRAKACGVEIIAFTDPSVPAWIKADGRALRRILLSLGKNALQNSSSEEVVLYAEVDNKTKSYPSIRFYVSGFSVDSSPQDLPPTFEDLINAEISNGVGLSSLNLAAAAKLARTMGNGIQLATSPAKGYVFTFTIKLTEASGQSAGPVYDLTDVRILVVDDNAVSRQALLKMLESRGCKARTVAHGAEVLPALVRGLLSNSPFRVVVLDLQMPGINGEEVLLAIRQHKLARDTKVVMLVPFGHPDKSDKAYSQVCSGALSKPVRRGQLLEMVEFALGLRLAAPGSLMKLPKIEDAAKGPAKRKLNILLAEDDVLSQQIATLLLAQLGLSPDLVFNGVEALAAVKSHDYDLIFMDMQMPQMNGMEAAREIRKLEGAKKNIPIIAMTASDIKESEQRCLESGMNGYITKPLDIKRISQVIRACLEGVYKQASNPLFALTPDSSPLEAPMLDVLAVLPIFGNDLHRYRDFLEEFLRSLPARLDLIEAAYHIGDLNVLGREAHTLKGISATLGATKLSKLASRLDTQSRGQQSETIAVTVRDIHDIIKELLLNARGMVPTGITQELRFKTRVICAPS